MTEVIFARVGPELKAAVDEFAETRGMTLAGAVSDLLARGREAAASEQSVQSLLRQLEETRIEVLRLRSELEATQARAMSSAAREHSLQQFVGELDAAAIGVCPQAGCPQRVSAIDLVVRRTCKDGHSLGPLLERLAKTPGMDTGQALVAVGAIGLVLALIASGGQ